MQNSYDVLHGFEMTELDICNQNIDLFNKYINDYECLRERLTTFPDKSSYDIMVPIAGSKIAFMPGYIHHTNEILVLIGDNYFVEKSAKETLEFIDRRIAFCNKNLEKLKSQQTMLQNWLAATENVKIETEQLVDITETWTEKELEEWKKQHRQRVKECKTKHETNDKIDINTIFEKYEKEEKLDVDQPTAVINEQPFNLAQSEQGSLCLPATTHEVGTTTGAYNTTESRPISRFKASRMKK